MFLLYIFQEKKNEILKRFILFFKKMPAPSSPNHFLNKAYIYVIVEYMFIMENECNRNYEFKKILNDEIHVIPTVFINF